MARRVRLTRAAAELLVLFAAASPTALPAASPAVDPRSEAPADGPGDLVFAAGGDLLGPYQPFNVEGDSGLRAVSSLFAHADVGFANQEGSIFDLRAFIGYPAAENGGGYPVQPAQVARDLRAFGVNLVSKANNHATDWGAEGLVATLGALAAAGIAEAGAGLSDTQARAPVYVRTRKGVVALVDCASTFPPMATAGPAVQRAAARSLPRPGISALHVREIRLVTPGELRRLARIAAAPILTDSERRELRIGDQVFRASSETGAIWEMEPDDEAAVLGSVREARAHARLVVFSIHAHETAGDQDTRGADYEPAVLHRANEAPSPNDPRPAGFEPVLFHAAIDAGADMVVRTGPHLLGGIEIYRGHPIFYSLGSLFFSFHGLREYTTPAGQKVRFPDAWFESIIPVVTYAKGHIREITLYPITIESSLSETDGYPRPASGDQAIRILRRVAAMSRRFGTRIAIEGDVGVIRPPA